MMIMLSIKYHSKPLTMAEGLVAMVGLLPDPQSARPGWQFCSRLLDPAEMQLGEGEGGRLGSGWVGGWGQGWLGG